MERIVFDNDNYTLFFDEDCQMAKLVWFGSPETEVYKEAFQNVLEFAKENKILYFISDVRKQGVIPPEYRDWLINYIFPLAKNHGVKKIGVISKKSPTKEYYLNHLFLAGEKLGFDLRLFNDPEKVNEWFCM